MNQHEQDHQRKVAELGCIACLLDGNENLHVSIHHVNGRTKKGAHIQVLPLCGEHHQNTSVAVHPNKATFERLFGTQESLLVLVEALLGGMFGQRELIALHKESIGK